MPTPLAVPCHQCRKSISNHGRPCGDAGNGICNRMVCTRHTQVGPISPDHPAETSWGVLNPETFGGLPRMPCGDGRKRFNWLVAKESLWFYIVFFGLPPIIGLLSNLPGFRPTRPSLLTKLHEVVPTRPSETPCLPFGFPGIHLDFRDEHWSAGMTAIAASAGVAGLISVVWHMWQAFRRSLLVGLVFSLTRLGILFFYFAGAGWLVVLPHLGAPSDWAPMCCFFRRCHRHMDVYPRGARPPGSETHPALLPHMVAEPLLRVQPRHVGRHARHWRGGSCPGPPALYLAAPKHSVSTIVVGCLPWC